MCMKKLIFTLFLALCSVSFLFAEGDDDKVIVKNPWTAKQTLKEFDYQENANVNYEERNKKLGMRFLPHIGCGLGKYLALHYGLHFEIRVVAPKTRVGTSLLIRTGIEYIDYEYSSEVYTSYANGKPYSVWAHEYYSFIGVPAIAQLEFGGPDFGIWVATGFTPTINLDVSDHQQYIRNKDDYFYVNNKYPNLGLVVYDVYMVGVNVLFAEISLSYMYPLNISNVTMYNNNLGIFCTNVSIRINTGSLR